LVDGGINHKEEFDYAMAVKRGHKTSTSDPGAKQVQKKVKVADLVQNSRMERQLKAPLPAIDQRQEPLQLNSLAGGSSLTSSI